MPKKSFMSKDKKTEQVHHEDWLIDWRSVLNSILMLKAIINHCKFKTIICKAQFTLNK